MSKCKTRCFSQSTLFLAISALLGAQSAIGQDVSDDSQGANLETEEHVVVTGKKASLITSLNKKREARSVIDGISAEELGLFPDANVADSLSHIPGVTIDRTRGGEGKGVNIRGLGAEFSIVTMNGRLLATDQEGREFAFDVLPAEVISSAWVHKSVTAKTLEGSIGGAVDLITAKPFDREGMSFSSSVEGTFSDKSDDSGYKITGVLGNTNTNKTFGFLATLLYSNTPTRNDELTDLNYVENWSWDHDDDPGWVNWQDASNELRLPQTFAYGAFIEDKQRTAVSTVLQFKPSDSAEFTFDALYTRLDAPSTAYTASWYTIGAADRWENVQYSGPTDVVSPNEDENPDGEVLNPQGIFVTGYDITDLTPELVTETEYRVVDTYQLGLNGAFTISDSLSLNADVYASNAKRDAGGKDMFIASRAVGALPNSVSFELNDGGLPNLEIDFSDNPDVNSMAELVSDEHFGPHYSQSTGVDVEDDVFGLSFDGDWVSDLSFIGVNLSSVDFGVNYSDRKKSRRQYDNEHARELYSGAPFTFADTGVSVVRQVELDNFLSQVSGEFPGIFVGFDPDAYQQALAAADNNPNIINPETGVSYPEGYSNQDEPRFNGNASFSVEETTQSAYVQANLEGNRWWANVGLRHTETETASNGWLAEIERIRLTSWGGYYPEYGALDTVSESNSYAVTLPSFNFGYDITDDLIARLTLAKVMSRASMNQLSTQVDNQYLTWGEWTTLYVGNPALQPVEANQADVTLEWYYKEGSGVTAGLFYKEIEGFIQDWQEVYPGTWDNSDRPTYAVEQEGGSYVDVPFNEFEPKNLDAATALGFEAGVQHFFDNGFGIVANFTQIDTESVISEETVGVLPGVAERFYSVNFIYENDKFSGQLYVNHTEGYTDSHWSPLNIYDSTDYKSTVDAFTDASISANYAFSDEVTAYIELDNLLNDSWHSYAGRPDLPASYAEWGRRLNIGVRYKF